MTSYVFLKEFENENQFNLLLDELQKSINVDDQDPNSIKPNSNIYPFVFDVLIDNIIYKIQFLKYKKVLNKFTFKILYDFYPKIFNIKLIDRFRKIYTPHAEMSYFDGNYLHIYASNYLESIDFLYLILTGTHYFKGMIDTDALEYNLVYDTITFDKNIFFKPKKYIINKIYDLI